jgi:hypothetical protein
MGGADQNRDGREGQAEGFFGGSDMSKHTPGPWEYDMKNEAVYAGRNTIVYEGNANEADYRLIAAAPELLEALQEILDYSGGADNALEDEYVMDRARAAIAKATGE